MFDFERPNVKPENIEELARFVYRLVDNVEFALNDITDTSSNTTETSETSEETTEQ